MSLSSDGKSIYSGSNDNTIRVWNLENGECVQTLAGHSDGVTCMSLSSDGKSIYSGSNDTTIRVWNLENGECVQTLAGHSNGVTCMSLSVKRGYFIINIDRELKT
jgi:WD40 repeat protein